MKKIRLGIMLLGLAGVLSGMSAHAEDATEPVVLQKMLSLHANQADWTFSGIITNESGERYHYFFQIQRNDTRFHGLATVIDGQSKSVLIYEEGSTLIEQPELTHWQVGNMFLRFNPINNSWVFGVKNKGQKGFNFKVDLFGLTDKQLSKQQDLRSGIELLISQTGHLNGHLQIDETGHGQEQFVTAKKSWFRQIWVNKPQTAKHPLTSVLCEFNDGSAFYSVTIPEADALRGSIASWRDGQGTPVAMSQFVTIHEEKNNLWQIHIPSPKALLSLQNMLDKINETHQLVIGPINGAMPGFCAISREEIDEQITP